MRPDCPDALKLMAYMDGELSPVERAPISAHLSSCPDCSSFLETQGALERSWRDSWQDPPDFRFNVMRKKLFSGGGSFRLPGWAIGIAAGAAAVFLGIRVFHPAEQSSLESRMREEAFPQVVTSGPAPSDSQALIDSIVPLSEETEETEAFEEETPQTAAVSQTVEEPRGGTGGIGEAVQGEVALAPGEDTIVLQSQESDEFTGDLEGMAFAESQDDACLSGSGVAAASFGMQSVGAGGYALEETEACQSSVSTVNSQPAVSSGRAAQEVSRDQPDSDMSVIVTLLCERPDGASVSPWKELYVFVDSLFQTRSNLPAMFNIDPLGYTVEQDGIPRVYLGVDDPGVVPLTVKVILH
ncbi:MAG: anti-sigma factor [Candidatus Fermentibacteraceae bacterium]